MVLKPMMPLVADVFGPPPRAPARRCHVRVPSLSCGIVYLE